MNRCQFVIKSCKFSIVPCNGISIKFRNLTAYFMWSNFDEEREFDICAYKHEITEAQTRLVFGIKAIVLSLYLWRDTYKCWGMDSFEFPL